MNRNLVMESLGRIVRGDVEIIISRSLCSLQTLRTGIAKNAAMDGRIEAESGRCE